MKYCVFTFIFNNYEPVRELEKVDSDCDYILFTDNKYLTSNTWQVVYLKNLDSSELSGVQKTFILKYQCYKYIPNYKQYDYFIQLDGSIILKDSLRPIVDYMDKFSYDIACAIHPHRNNVIDEYHAWMGRNIDPKYQKIFVNFAKNYQTSCNGLMEDTVKIYKNTKQILNFIDDMNGIMTYANNNTDPNDQCYFTYTINQYIDKLRILYLHADIYWDSKYMNKCIHNTNTVTGKSHAYYDNKLYIKFLDKYIHIIEPEEFEQFA